MTHSDFPIAKKPLSTSPLKERLAAALSLERGRRSKIEELILAWPLLLSGNRSYCAHSQNFNLLAHTLSENNICCHALFWHGQTRATLLALPAGNITPVWIASGIILATVLLRGHYIWPGILLGAFAHGGAH